jgi:hypothetical protein
MIDSTSPLLKLGIMDKDGLTGRTWTTENLSSKGTPGQLPGIYTFITVFWFFDVLGRLVLEGKLQSLFTAS